MADRRSLRFWLTRPFVVLIRAYQLGISPLIGANCRFVPSCSQYGIEALETFGVVRGGWLTICRILRCRPGGGSGYDPVPQPQLQQDMTE
ncbi:MAG: membrane protein insertion efficiency factor YidD [Gammaproteobacteria bacterium]